ncbi:PleD family two-component system response regulator [Candidatus Omnitrophota bacterium]
MSKKILIIDDEPEIVKLLGTRLKANGYDVATAENGEEGLKEVEAAKPDLIILDVLMPVMDGFTFFKTIKQDEKKSEIPILVLTGRGGMRDTFEALDADEFVSKPFDDVDLIKKIEACFKKKILLFTDDSALRNAITKDLEKSNSEIHCVENENDFFEKGMRVKYAAIVVHLALVAGEPQQLISRVNRFKSKIDKLIIYCNSLVKGTEDGNTVAINDIKTQWVRSGVEGFFDSRIDDKPFPKVLEQYLS